MAAPKGGIPKQSYSLFLTMKQVSRILFSSGFMAVVMIVFAVSIGIATFIENDFGGASARAMVYNARWFEILLLLAAVNLTGSVFTRKLYTRAKLPALIFHLAFVVILAGAAVSRYSGTEGTVSLRERQVTNRFLTDKAYIGLTINDSTSSQLVTIPVFFTPVSRNKVSRDIRYQNNNIRLNCKSVVFNAVPDIVDDVNGKPVAEIIYADSTGRKSELIASGEIKTVGLIRFAFNTPAPDSLTIALFTRGDTLCFTAPYPVTLANMTGESFAILERNLEHTFALHQLYTFGENMIVLNRFMARGKRIPRTSPQNQGPFVDALEMELTSGQESRMFYVWGKTGTPGVPEQVALDKLNFLISYGSIYKELPFELKLIDFNIERYPGSQSPSSFESDVLLTDMKRQYQNRQLVYMNNILKYKGYRFYQASYDPDEKGTILSVNRDPAGTFISYLGYFLAGLCMLLSLFIKGNRFSLLSAELRKIGNIKKGTTLFVLLLLHAVTFGQPAHPVGQIVPVNREHAVRFGKMLVQDNGGRIEPVNTLSNEILRKISRKSTYKGLNSDQVMLGMMASPEAWQHEPVIRATHPQIQELLGSHEKHHAFSSFFRGDQYILQSYIEKAYRKKNALRSKFDNEIIRLDERVNITYLVFSGAFMRVFPVSGDSTFTWHNHQDIRGKTTAEDSVFAGNIFYLYIQEVQKSLNSGNWKVPDDILNAVEQYQHKHGSAIIPASSRISLEILMNKTDVFSRISKYYGLIGLALLLLQFTGLFYTRLKLRVPVIIFSTLIIIIFIIHTAGLGLRWYLSGHAPMSNGYEALTYVAWAAVLAGLIFASRSSITLSVTSILAFLILFVAHLSWMDPQITNLVPVLKSYWLVMHVATITASYGFFALSALLGFINLLLITLRTVKSDKYLQLNIREITGIIEMSLMIGLFLLTIGVFLGAVWANESWGRYWGWDPKETWALITVLIYAFILHMRLIPGLKSMYAFNLASLVGIGSVLMTYFGVNYYLSGLHSYAKGDPVPVPSFVFITILVILITAVMAYIRYKKLPVQEHPR
ncbi:MAG: cytochrome c biogenesis protein CcsA [Bacteroidales bacterium]|nr:cytochrome c biogenesis protein CcsA [Bacteroidales bacterium]